MLEIARGLGYEGSFMEVMRCRIHGNGALSPVPRHPFPSKDLRWKTKNAGRSGPAHAIEDGGPSGSRTLDLGIKSPLLCQLS